MKLVLSKLLINQFNNNDSVLLKNVNKNRKKQNLKSYNAVELINKMISDINNKYADKDDEDKINIDPIKSLNDIQTIDKFDPNLIDKNYIGYIINDNKRVGDIVIAHTEKHNGGGNIFINQQLLSFLLSQLEFIPDYFVQKQYKRIVYSATPLSGKLPSTTRIDLKCLKTLHYDIVLCNSDTTSIKNIEPYTNPEKIMEDYQQGQKENNRSSALTYDEDTDTYTLSIKGKVGSGAYYYELLLITIYTLSRPKLKINAEKLDSNKNLQNVIRYFNSLIPTTPFKYAHSLPLGKGHNEIYYGAPGTGKSFTVNKLYPNARRVTFYPTFDYTDFIGGLKPVRINGNLDYKFVPGPLTNTIIDALNHPELDEVALIIDEINRAEAASVFGDTFQLLDRQENNISQYSIYNSQVAKYIDDHTKSRYNFTDNGIQFPGNLSLIATMNPADQGVFVLDSAFKRRWQMHYCPIKWTDETNNLISIGQTTVAGFDITWQSLADHINKILLNLGLNEDALLGQYFFTKEELSKSDLVRDKLLSYLWNDVARYKRDAIFESKTYSDLINKFNFSNKKTNIFKSGVWNSNDNGNN